MFRAVRFPQEWSTTGGSSSPSLRQSWTRWRGSSGRGAECPSQRWLRPVTPWSTWCRRAAAPPDGSPPPTYLAVCRNTAKGSQLTCWWEAHTGLFCFVQHNSDWALVQKPVNSSGKINILCHIFSDFCLVEFYVAYVSYVGCKRIKIDIGLFIHLRDLTPAPSVRILTT